MKVSHIEAHEVFSVLGGAILGSLIFSLIHTKPDHTVRYIIGCAIGCILMSLLFTRGITRFVIGHTDLILTEVQPIIAFLISLLLLPIILSFAKNMQLSTLVKLFTVYLHKTIDKNNVLGTQQKLQAEEKERIKQEITRELREEKEKAEKKKQKGTKKRQSSCEKKQNQKK